jgi:CheY-like chemotaxis protein
MTLPLLDLEEATDAGRPDRPAVAGVEMPDDAPRLDGLRVLLVDRSEEVREVVARILRLAGASVDTAESVTAAMTAFAGHVPDVLVSELDMEGETGYSLIRKVRSLPQDMGGAVPAAALTVHSRMEDRVRALRSGFQIYMGKPIQPAELLAVVAALAEINRRR